MSELKRRLNDHFKSEVNINVYEVPGIMDFLKAPRKGIQYIKEEMQIGIYLSLAFIIVGAYCTVYLFEELWTKSRTLPFSMSWMTLINAAAVIPKIYVFNKLKTISADQSPDQIRRAMIDIFKRKYYSYNILLSIVNKVTYLVSIPISVYLWKLGVPECSYLLIFSIIYILRFSLGIFRFNSYFLTTYEPQDNPHALRQIKYNKKAVERSDPQLLGSTCSICMLDYKEGDRVLEFACGNGHYFHQSCLNRWMAHSPLCPLCKRHV